MIKSRCPGLPGHPRAPWPAMVEPKALPRNGCASWCLGGCSWSCEFGYLWRSCIAQTGSTGDLVQLATPGFQVIWLKDWAKKIGSQRWIRVIHRHYQSSWSLYRVSSVYKYIYIHICSVSIPYHFNVTRSHVSRSSDSRRRRICWFSFTRSWPTGLPHLEGIRGIVSGQQLQYLTISYHYWSLTYGFSLRESVYI